MRAGRGRKCEGTGTTVERGSVKARPQEGPLEEGQENVALLFLIDVL